ncbi:MAG: methionine--tRNA ligase [Bacteroidetes bacterium]|nr:methionine--tRNA ligase [Bacteroidota bacterium]
MVDFKRYTVTAALPYANGPVHIGHIAGNFLPADVYSRYLRARGRDVLFVCGSDEHGVGISIKAQQEGKTPKEVVDKYHEMMKKSLHEFGMSFDIYSRTSSKEHYQTAQDFFTNLLEKGIFEKKVSKQFYDVKLQQFLADRYIYGSCPNCGYTHAYGDQCERCGTSLDPMDLIEPKSALSNETPELKETEHWYLPLDKYEDWLKSWILENHSDWKANVVGQCRSWLTQGLHARAVTRDLDWGVPVPLKEAKGKVLYVWFDAPIGYISMSKEWAAQTGKDWKPYWQSDDTKLVHFIGKDNIVFHCVIFPVMLKAHGDFILPENVPANEFLNLEGDKISTSRNWAVWLHEYLLDFADKQDVLRYVLCANAPETKDNDFTWKDFQAKNNSELVAILGNLVNRIFVLTHKYYEDEIPAITEVTEVEKTLMADCAAYPQKIAGLIEEYKLREALQELMNLARVGNKYLTETEPWKIFATNPERVKTILHFGLQLIADLSILMEPFLPFTSIKLKNALGGLTPNPSPKEREMISKNWDDAGHLNLLTAGNKITQTGILFEKIEDVAIAHQMEKLEQSRPKVEVTEAVVGGTPDTTEIKVGESPTLAGKPEITFDDFSKMDLRIATILAAEKIEKSDKLLKLEIDLGFEKRTIVSGIAKHFAPEEIIGKQVCIVANLAPRKIMNIASKGMVLMIENQAGELVMLNPEKEVEAGAKVS